MKITTTQLRQIIREEIKKIKKEGYGPVIKNMGYTADKTEPSEYTKDGAGLLKKELRKKK